MGRSSHTETQKHGNTEIRLRLLGVAPPAASHTPQPKRLTLDLAPEVHRALKLCAVDLDVSMAELLRALIEQALSEPSKLARLADDLRTK